MFRLKGYAEGINEESIREFTKAALDAAPDYFWRIPASSSGNHHPSWALVEGGLVRHTTAGAYLVDELSRTFGLTDLESDIAMSAILLHDTIKHGVEYSEERVYFDMHPFTPRPYYKQKGLELDKLTSFYDEIMTTIERHMGSLEDGSWTSVGRIKPEKRVEKVVHLADYIASRKDISFRFLGGGETDV